MALGDGARQCGYGLESRTRCLVPAADRRDFRCGARRRDTAALRAAAARATTQARAVWAEIDRVAIQSPARGMPWAGAAARPPGAPQGYPDRPVKIVGAPPPAAAAIGSLGSLPNASTGFGTSPSSSSRAPAPTARLPRRRSRIRRRTVTRCCWQDRATSRWSQRRAGRFATIPSPTLRRSGGSRGFRCVLAVNVRVPATTIAELVAVAKAQPRSLSYASTGIQSRLAAELFARQPKSSRSSRFRTRACRQRSPSLLRRAHRSRILRCVGRCAARARRDLASPRRGRIPSQRRRTRRADARGARRPPESASNRGTAWSRRRRRARGPREAAKRSCGSAAQSVVSAAAAGPRIRALRRHRRAIRRGDCRRHCALYERAESGEPHHSTLKNADAAGNRCARSSGARAARIRLTRTKHDPCLHSPAWNRRRAASR